MDRNAGGTSTTSEVIPNFTVSNENDQMPSEVSVHLNMVISKLYFFTLQPN